MTKLTSNKYGATQADRFNPEGAFAPYNYLSFGSKKLFGIVARSDIHDLRTEEGVAGAQCKVRSPSSTRFADASIGRWQGGEQVQRRELPSEVMEIVPRVCLLGTHCLRQLLCQAVFLDVCHRYARR